MAAPDSTPAITLGMNGAADPSAFPRTRKLLEEQRQANQQQAQALQEWHQQLQAREQAVNARELELEQREKQADMWETLEEQRALAHREIPDLRLVDVRPGDTITVDGLVFTYLDPAGQYDPTEQSNGWTAPSPVDSPTFVAPVQTDAVWELFDRLKEQIDALDGESVEIGPPEVKPDANSRCHLCDQRFDYQQGELAVVLSRPGKRGQLFHEQCLQWFTHSVEPSRPRVPEWAVHAACAAVFSTWALWVWWIVERAST